MATAHDDDVSTADTTVVSQTSSPMSERERIVYQLKLCEMAEADHDMRIAAQRLIHLESRTTAMTTEELNLVAVAYQRNVGSLRASWRIVTSLYQKNVNQDPEERITSEQNLLTHERWLQSLENELVELCSELIELMKQVVMEADTTAETRVMCYKRMADYARYCCDLQLIDVSTFHGLSTTYYTTAAEIAEADTSATSPVRLGLALSWSVWHAEILNDRNFALRIAQSAFDKALLDLDQLDEDSYKDTTLILQLLRDNITLWTNETGENTESS